MPEAAATLFIEMRAAFGRLQGDMNSVLGVLTNTEKRITGIGKTISKVWGAALTVGGIYAVKKLNDALRDLAERGEVAGSIAENFQKLGGSTKAIDDAKHRIVGLLDTFELMEVANKGLLANVQGFGENLANIADYSARFADSVNKDTKEVFENLTKAITTAKPGMLAQYGIIINQSEAYKTYAESIGVAAGKSGDFGKVLTDNQKKAALQAAANKEVVKSLERMAPITDSAANAFTALDKAWGEVIKNAGITANKTGELNTAIRELARSVSSLNLGPLITGFATVAKWSINIVGFLMKVGKALGGITRQGYEFAKSTVLIQGTGDSVLAQGKGESTLTSSFTQAAADAGKVIQEVNNLKSAIQAAPHTKWLQELVPRIEALRASASAAGAGPGLAVEIENLTKLAHTRFTELGGQISGSITKGAVIGLGNVEKVVAPVGASIGDTIAGEVSEGVTAGAREAAEAAKQAAEKVAALNAEWSEIKADTFGKGLQEGIQNAIDTLDHAKFDGLLKQIEENTRKGLEQAYEKFRGGGRTDAEINAQIEAETKLVVDGYRKNFKDANTDAAEDLRRKMEDAFGEAFDFFKGYFDKLFHGEAPIDFKEAFLDVASDMAATFASEALKGLFAGEGTLGQRLAQSIMNGLGGTGAGGGGGIGDFIQNLFGGAGGGTTEAAHKAGVQGPGLESGQFGGGQSNAGYYASALATAASAMNASKINKQTKSEAGTGGAVGSAAGTAIGAYVGGPMGAAIGSTIGQAVGSAIGGYFKHGSQNPQTQARHQFANYIEDSFKKLGKVQFYDKGGLRDVDMKNPFKEGAASRFSGSDWGKDFEQMGGEVKSVFTGLGEALEELQGLTEDVGGQLGYMLAKNFGGSIDNARLLVDYLGLSLEQVEEALVKTGNTGEASWHEVEIALQGVHQAFGEGLVAAGAFGDAFDHIIQSGGRGRLAIKSLRDVAVEATEAGLTSLDQVKQQLLQQGKSQEEVSALFQGLASRGITSLEQLGSATDRVLGGVIADMQTAFGGSWKEVAEQTEQVAKNIQEIPDVTEYTVHGKYTADFDENTLKAQDAGLFPGGSLPAVTETAAKGTVIGSPALFAARRGGLGLAGEAGPEAILPLKRVGGHLGVSAAGMGSGVRPVVAYNIDARGADPGVEHRIRKAIRDSEDRAVSRAARLVSRGR